MKRVKSFKITEVLKGIEDDDKCGSYKKKHKKKKKLSSGAEENLLKNDKERFELQEQQASALSFALILCGIVAESIHKKMKSNTIIATYM